METEAAKILQAIRAAFPEDNLPDTDEIVVKEWIPERPFETNELKRGLIGKKWPEIERDWILTHPHWLMYCSPVAFRYYIPAWMIHGLDWFEADYAGDWIASTLSGPMPDEIETEDVKDAVAGFTPEQCDVILDWWTYLWAVYPEEDIGFLAQKGMTIEDVVRNWTDRRNGIKKR